MYKKMFIIVIVVLFLAFGLSGCNEQYDWTQYSEPEIFQKLMDNKIGDCTIIELINFTINSSSSEDGGIYLHDEYVHHLKNEMWEVGFYITNNEYSEKYSWEYNVKTDEETPITTPAQRLYRQII